MEVQRDEGDEDQDFNEVQEANQLKDQNVKITISSGSDMKASKTKKSRRRLPISSGSDIGLNSPNHHRQTEEKKGEREKQKGEHSEISV